MYYDLMEPPLTIPQLRYIKMDVEGEQGSYKSKLVGGTTFDTRRLYLAPGVGIGWDYFLYHPDLFTFAALAEPGYTWQQVDNSGVGNSSDTFLLNGRFNGILLREKPYSSTINYNRSRDEYHYDFFNSATVDAEGYGASTGYHEGPVPVTLSFQQSHTDSTSLNQETLTDQTTIDLHARNERKKQDITDFTYQFGKFDVDSRYQLSAYSTENSYHHVSVNDAEHFDKSTLHSGLLFYDTESTAFSSENLNGSVGYNYEHTPHLNSFYNYTLSQYSANGSDSIQNYGSAGLQHQLYDSLVSSANVHGATSDSSSGGSKLDSLTLGAGGSVGYMKRLGDWGHLNIGNGASYDVTHQDVTGSQLLIANESHTVPTSGPTVITLSQPRDLSVISVTDANGTPLSQGTDYTVSTATDPWQIQITPAGLGKVPPGSTVLVTYTIQSNPSGSYSIFADNASFSIRFWQDRAEVYARYNFTDNQANSPDFLLQNVHEFETGASCGWNGLQVAASYTDHNSTLYDYTSYTLSEGYSMPVLEHSTAGIDLSQQWTHYPAGSGTVTNQAQNAVFYNYMLHYAWQPVAAMNWNAEVGYQQQRGLGFDEDLFAARTYFNWTVGRLEMRLGYVHEYQEYTSEIRERDFVFLRMRRNF